MDRHAEWLASWKAMPPRTLREGITEQLREWFDKNEAVMDGDAGLTTEDKRERMAVNAILAEAIYALERVTV